MTTNSETILSEHTHPNDNTLITVVGDPYKGDGYYGRSDGLHTIQYTYTDFAGDITIEATLAVDPTEDDWFEAFSFSTMQDTGSSIANFTGNYVWVRAVVSYTTGTINSIRMNH